jgi:hypothetical protein
MFTLLRLGVLTLLVSVVVALAATANDVVAPLVAAHTARLELVSAIQFSYTATAANREPVRGKYWRFGTNERIRVDGPGSPTDFYRYDSREVIFATIVDPIC